jgi:membrane-bound lytic murein transglycosylase A
MTPHSPGLRFAVLTLAALCLAGCVSSQRSIAPTPLPFKARYGTDNPVRFTPQSAAGAFRLSEKEAAALVARLSPGQQGLASWRDMDFPLGQSLAYARGKPRNAGAINMPGLTANYGRLADSLEHLQGLLPRLDADAALLAREFTWYRIGPDFLYTGYFEPTLKASRRQSANYPYPLYRVPPDLKKGKAYYTRNDIDRKGVLAGKGLEIAWVHSEMEAFFLHIQGSGRLEFEDGSMSHVLYAGKNNRAYVPIGRVMRERGLLDENNVNMPSIKACLLGNPDKCAEIYDSNPSYVFFREASKGPLGAMGRPLTPYVSVASDRSVLPLGSLTCVVAPLPDGAGKPTRGLHALALPQDTGGAIKRNRVDLFCGAGDEAAFDAGYMNFRGPVYVLLKKITN